MKLLGIGLIILSVGVTDSWLSILTSILCFITGAVLLSEDSENVFRRR